MVGVGGREVAEPTGDTGASGARGWRAAPDELQRRFTDQAGRTVAVVDFWWERARLIGEADGLGPHSTPYALARDRERQNALQRLYPDVRIARFTWADLHRPKYILALVAGEE